MKTFIKSKKYSPIIILFLVFSFGIFHQSYASDNVSTTTASTSTSQVLSHYFCSKIGACLYVVWPAYLNSNSSSTLEIWNTNGNEWSIITIFENPDIILNFDKVEPTEINLFGNQREAKEIMLTGSTTDKTVYRLFSDYTEGSSTVIVLVTSNESVLGNGQLMTILAGENPASTTVQESFGSVATTTVGTNNIFSFLPPNILTILPLLVIGLILVIFIIVIICMLVGRSKKKSQSFIPVPPKSENPNVGPTV